MIKSPYVGLRPFKREESRVFFGREHPTVDLLEQLSEKNFLAIVGHSGSGKTSLINAGLIPCLLEGALEPPGPNWQIAEMRPGTKPFFNLVTALQTDQALGGTLSLVPFDQDTLSARPTSLHELMAASLLTRNGKLVIICDQFEDVFRFPCDEVSHFIDLLVTSSQPYSLPSGGKSKNIYVILALRSNYLAECELFPPLAEAMNQGLYLIPSLNTEQIRTVIEKPLYKYGGEIEPELVAQLLADADRNQDQLPLLQHVLSQLWTKSIDKKLTIFDYFVLGGLKRALSNHADQIYQSLTSEQQNIAEQLFKSLAAIGNKNGLTSVPIRLSEVAAQALVHWEGVAAVVNAFREEEQGILLPAPPVVLYPDTVLHIANDSFLRQWQRLSQWIEEESRSAECYARLLDRAISYRNKQAALLTSPELEMLVQWFDEARPSPAWAERYGGDFSLATAFLDKSKHFAFAKKMSLILACCLGVILFMLGLNNVNKPAPSLSSGNQDVTEDRSVNRAQETGARLKNNSEAQQHALSNKTLATDSRVQHIDPTDSPAIRSIETTAAASGMDKKTLTDLSKRYPDKLRLLQEYKKLAINDSVVWQNLGNELKHQANLEHYGKKKQQFNDAAIEVYEKAVELDPENYTAWFSLGDIYRLDVAKAKDDTSKDELRRKAIDAYTKVTLLYPKSEWAYYYIGTLYQQQKKFVEAIENYKKQLDVTPTHKFAWHYLATAHQKLHQAKEAIAAYKEDLKINPNNAEAKKQLHHLINSLL